MSVILLAIYVDVKAIFFSDEQDEETAEWEYEQLRRGGLRTADSEANVKPVYKPAPSMSFFQLGVRPSVCAHARLVVPPVIPVP